MKKWTRLTVVIAVVATALTVGLTGASASGTPNGGPTPPDSGTRVAHAAPAETPPVQPHSPRPPARAETVYVAITPCRIIDTRLGGGKFTNGTTRTYYVGGTFGFAPQGGTSGGCGIPIGATAIAASIGSTNSERNGYLVAWPQNLSKPLASNLNYTKGQSIASGGNISIQKNSALALRIYNFGGPTDVFMDVTGYYTQQMQGMIGSDGSVYSGSDGIVSATVINPGVYRVTFDNDVSYCTPMVNTYSGKGVYGSAYAFAGTSVYVYTWYISGTTHLEVNNSYYFYITVTC
ncbi:hypothetical protein ABIB25_001624 [Nakamurella sp. UYEF19]|uniref:hypothetical protein n=1 Tax=Nakamurella sp. UYEF19 TaxID=1756392 RepID=UPI00339B8752